MHSLKKKRLFPKLFSPTPSTFFSLIVHKIFHVTFASNFSVTHSEKNLKSWILIKNSRIPLVNTNNRLHYAQSHPKLQISFTLWWILLRNEMASRNRSLLHALSDKRKINNELEVSAEMVRIGHTPFSFWWIYTDRLFQRCRTRRTITSAVCKWSGPSNRAAFHVCVPHPARLPAYLSGNNKISWPNSNLFFLIEQCDGGHWLKLAKGWLHVHPGTSMPFRLANDDEEFHPTSMGYPFFPFFISLVFRRNGEILSTYFMSWFF